jgi:hypothetical protein
MSFFDSEIVRAEMAEIQELQEEVYGSVMNFALMDDDDKVDHIELLERLIDRQKILYARLSLSDDPEAKKLKDEITKSAIVMGLPDNVDMNIIFNQMTQMVSMMKQQLDIS